MSYTVYITLDISMETVQEYAGLCILPSSNLHPKIGVAGWGGRVDKKEVVSSAKRNITANGSRTVRIAAATLPAYEVMYGR